MYMVRALTIATAFSGERTPDVHVDAEDLEPPGHPLHVLDQLGVARARADLLLGPVRERVGARAHQPHAPLLHQRVQLGQGAFQVLAGLVHGRADPGDDLDRRLEQLVLGLGVLAVRVVPAEQRQDLRRPAAELAGLPVDDLELDLHTEAGPFRGPEIDLHGGFPCLLLLSG
jgi:hypothetical protein